MKEVDWQDILEHPDRPLTKAQWDMLTKVNIVALTDERRAELAERLLIEGKRLYDHASAIVDVAKAPLSGGKVFRGPDPKSGSGGKR